MWPLCKLVVSLGSCLSLFGHVCAAGSPPWTLAKRWLSNRGHDTGVGESQIPLELARSVGHDDKETSP